MNLLLADTRVLEVSLEAEIFPRRFASISEESSLLLI
jgi:hypothetical protein